MLKQHSKITQSCCSSTVSDRLRYHVPKALSLYMTQGMRKGIRYPSCKTVAIWKAKYINLVCYSCLKHANEMLLADPQQTDQRTQSFNFSTVNHQSLDLTAQAPYMLAWLRFLHAVSMQFAFWHYTGKRAHSSTWVLRRAVEVIVCMITRHFKVISMTSTSLASLSLCPLLTKVTHTQ